MTSLTLADKHVLRNELELLTQQTQEFINSLLEPLGGKGKTDFTRTKLAGYIGLSQLILQSGIHGVPRSRPVLDDRLNEEALRTVASLASENMKSASVEVEDIAKVAAGLRQYRYVEEVQIWEFLHLLEASGLPPQEALDKLPHVIRWAKSQTKTMVLRLTNPQESSVTNASQTGLDFSQPTPHAQGIDTAPVLPIRPKAKSRRKLKIPV